MFPKSKSSIIVAAIFLLISLTFIGLKLHGDNDPDALEGRLYTSMARPGEPVSVQQILLGKADAPISEAITLPGLSVLQFYSAVLSDGVHGFMVTAPATGVTATNPSNIMHRLPHGGVSLLLPFSNSLVRERDLTYSNAAGLLAFSAQTLSAAQELASTDDLNSVSAWGIYTVDLEQKELVYRVAGRDPQWAPDGQSFLYLGADGLYQYEVATGAVTPVVVPGVTATFGENMNLAVDGAGQYVAISSPNDRTLFVGRIDAWQPVTIENLTPYTFKTDVYEHTFFWPTFSPDGQYLAVQMTDVQYQTEQINPRIGIIDIDSMSIVKVIPIADFDFNRAFIDEWNY